MDAPVTEPSLSYTAQPPVLLAGTSSAALRRARQAADLAGQRAGAELGIGEARDRLRQQASASAIWVEVDRDCGEELEALLDEAEAIALRRPFGMTLSVTGDLLDTLGERLFEGAVQILVDAGAADRAVALAMAAAAPEPAARAQDVANDAATARLRQLSDEVSRIAASLAQLSAPEASLEKLPDQGQGKVPEISAATVRSAIRARQMRGRFLPADLFGDPAWDMLLDLLQAEIEQARVPVSSLCVAAAVPGTTALRWLKSMTERGIFVRRPDPLDRRRIFVELSPDASAALRRYFASVAPAPVL